jgi:hypothetical protein
MDEKRQKPGWRQVKFGDVVQLAKARSQDPLADGVASPAIQLATLPPELATILATLKGRASTEALRGGILRLCAWTPLTVEQLATFLEKDRHYLRNKHLRPMVRDGLLRFRYPESAKHPHQAYITAGAEDKNHG